MKKKTISIIGSQMDMGAVRKGVDMGPLAIRHAGLVQMIRDIGYQVKDCGDILPMVATSEGSPKMRYEKEINEANERLFHKVLAIHENHEFPVILGGDHSIAAGSVSATAQHCGKIGVLWIDAHEDFNDDTITPTGNIHGMPLSAVCGCGPDSLVKFTQARVDPHNLAIIGVRELDPEETKKLKSKGVSVFAISDIHNFGIRKIMEDAMSVICWYCDVEPLSDPALFARGMAHLPWAERREKVLRFRFEKDRRLCLGAGLLLAHALRHAGAYDLSLSCLPHGKPVLKNQADLHFNLSHSGTLAVCAVSDQPVGADVEILQAADPGVAAMCFRADERAWMEQSDAPEQAFTRLWTRKESYLKLLGTGLLQSPVEISVLPGEGQPAGVRFSELEHRGHMICVCAQGSRDADFREWQLTPSL